MHAGGIGLFGALALVALGAGAAGCGKPAEGPLGSTADQATQGAALYHASCARCHGASGEGTAKGPPLVGKDALPLSPRPDQKLRKTQFRTAGDVLDFMKASMPLGAPGTLSPAEYADILAFALQANGVDLHGVRVSEENASSFVLHP